MEDLLDATDDPSIEDERYRYRKTVHALLTLWDRLPRGEQDKTLHYLKCELADSQPDVRWVDLGDEDADKDNQVLALAAMRENGLEIVVHCVFGEDDGFATLCLDVYCVSSKRPDDFFWWLSDLLEPFGGEVQEVRYGDRAGTGRQAADGPLTMQSKPVDRSRINPDVLLLHARAAADFLDVPIRELARLLPPPDRNLHGRRHWRMSTLECERSPQG